MTKVLECRNLVKTFHDGDRDLHVLRGVDLAVESNEILVISGPSGAGKSTLLHIIGTLDRPTKGEVLFQGKSLRSFSPSEINRIRNEEIGFVFQFYHLLPDFTALENVMMPALARGLRRKDCRERAEEILVKVGLGERLGHKPGKLSGGEQQRVAIGRALYNEPRIVLADEPTGNLDENTGREIIDLLWELNESDGMTLAIVSHNQELAARAHRWVHLQDGHAHLKSN